MRNSERSRNATFDIQSFLGSLSPSTPRAPVVAPAARRTAYRPQFAQDAWVVLRDVVRLLDIGSVLAAGLITERLQPQLEIALTRSVILWMLLAGGLFAAFLLRRSVPRRATDTLDLVHIPLARIGAVFLCLFASVYAIGNVSPAATHFLVMWSAWTVGLLVGERLLVLGFVQFISPSGCFVEHFAIVGAGPIADRLVELLESKQDSRTKVLGVFDDRGTARGEICRPAMGTINDLLHIGRRTSIDYIVIALPLAAEVRIHELSRRLKALATDIRVYPHYSHEATGSSALGLGEGVAGIPLLAVAPRPIAQWSSVIKRIEDVVLASLGLLLVGPVMIAAAIAIKIDSPGPVLFRQRRHGFNNTEFEVLKFRSMRVDKADALGARQTERSDSRITPVGRFLRRTSIDELPQLLNVLRGDMSIVGPRPLPIGMRTADRLCEEIVEDYAHRHRVKPGITGWAQVNGLRGATKTCEQLQARIDHDLYYIENWSVFFDLKVLIRTLFALVSQENAF